MRHDDEGRPDAGDPPGSGAWLEAVRNRYHVPPEPPREEMWAAIRAVLVADGLAGGVGYPAERDAGEAAGVARPNPSEPDGSPLHRVRSRGEIRPVRRAMRGWTWAAAAAVLAIGVGLGRWSVPAGGPAPVAEAALEADALGGERGGLELAARMHFGRSESLLAAVRSDAHSGRVDASVGPWARSLLAQTRLLMDARGGRQDDTQRLLTDLELVLAQIVGASESGALGEGRAREEMDLAVQSLDRGELLGRIRSAVPNTMSGA